MRKDNPEALLTRNGDKVFRPKWMLEEMAIKDKEWQIEKALMEADKNHKANEKYLDKAEKDMEALNLTEN